ncbi:hypothetical protein QVH35_02615 [Candidatus Nitrosotenuis chungbukensis]|uniref:hypothetical protein n=1 Tax=Candidatus Nitrosotenuis chungbukensis TaxID=1353246 RepID=UPI0005B29BC6|nr:hypothetical protein [Candidatus Nitrosotenuis chungbukensis]WKT58358.1 hypothetical protein QVH35_02615 [Candidatus Nitrosotenuis chungbukensis]
MDENAVNYIITNLLNMINIQTPMFELGKMEEGRAKNMNLYQSPRKAETGLGSDIVPQEREFTPVEIKSSVKETGKCYRTCPIVVHL